MFAMQERCLLPLVGSFDHRPHPTAFRISARAAYTKHLNLTRINLSPFSPTLSIPSFPPSSPRYFPLLPSHPPREGLPSSTRGRCTMNKACRNFSPSSYPLPLPSQASVVPQSLTSLAPPSSTSWWARGGRCSSPSRGGSSGCGTTCGATTHRAAQRWRGSRPPSGSTRRCVDRHTGVWIDL